MDAYAVLALSYGFRDGGSPCLSNVDLAREAEVFVRLGVSVIAQWEIGDIMNPDPTHIIRKHRIAGQYLDSDEVIAQGVDWLKQHHPDIRQIVVVAQPFIHLPLARVIVRRYGYSVRRVQIGPIRFDKQSAQWWTRGRIPSIIYLIRRVLFNVRGR